MPIWEVKSNDGKVLLVEAISADEALFIARKSDPSYTKVEWFLEDDICQFMHTERVICGTDDNGDNIYQMMIFCDLDGKACYHESNLTCEKYKDRIG